MCFRVWRKLHKQETSTKAFFLFFVEKTVNLKQPHNEVTEPAGRARKKKRRKKKKEVGGITPKRKAYLLILPSVLAATALNLSGRISIPAAAWPNRRWCPAHPPVLAESALSGSLLLSSVPTHSSLHLTVMGCREVQSGGLLPHWKTTKKKRCGGVTQPAWGLCPGLASMRMQCWAHYLYVLFIRIIYS